MEHQLILMLHFFDLYTAVEESKNLLKVLTFFCHLMGPVLAHAHSVTVAAAPYGKGPDSLLLVSGRLIHRDKRAGKRSPVGQSGSVIFRVGQLRAAQGVSDLSLPL